MTTITTRSASTWTLVVPGSLSAGSYQLRIHQGGLVSNPVTLQVHVPPVPLPHISSLSPTSGPVGTQVTLTGTSFPGTGTVLLSAGSDDATVY